METPADSAISSRTSTGSIASVKFDEPDFPLDFLSPPAVERFAFALRSLHVSSRSRSVLVNLPKPILPLHFSYRTSTGSIGSVKFDGTFFTPSIGFDKFVKTFPPPVDFPDSTLFAMVFRNGVSFNAISTRFSINLWITLAHQIYGARSLPMCHCFRNFFGLCN